MIISDESVSSFDFAKGVLMLSLDFKIVLIFLFFFLNIKLEA